MNRNQLLIFTFGNLPVLALSEKDTSDITEILRVNATLANRAEAVGKLLDDLDHFALYKDQAGFSTIISGLKADWFNGAGADGANWVLDILKKGGVTVFPPTLTNFEVQSVLGTVRRYDAVVTDAVTLPNGSKAKRFFEFKSYGTVPPANFNTQFINDLNNPEITDLSQLQWLFDAAKNPANFETAMKSAIDGLDMSNLPLSLFNKYGVADDIALKVKIKSQFTLIFSLK